MEMLGLFGVLYVANVVTWSIVSGIVWGITRVFQRGAEKRRIEPEAPPAGQSREALVYTFTRSLVALTFVQTVIFSFSPSAPSSPNDPLTIVFQVIAAMLLFDFAFYVSHRLQHTRWLWFVHGKHHEYRIVDFWVRGADHVGQVLITALFAAPVGFLLTNDAAKGIYFLMSTTFNVLQHCGYEVFPRQRWISRVFVTPTHHSMHHTERDCNYGYFFPFFDDLFGTMHPSYREKFLRKPIAAAVTEAAPAE